MPDLTQLISDAGLRPTKARLAVLEAIASADSALSHTEIVERLSTQKEFDRVTIYRVLDWLTEHHLVHKITGENRAWKFQFSQHTTAHQHAHLQCASCGKVICIHEIEPHFSQSVLNKYQVESIDIHLKGICPDCA
jgi:Fur family transcriptional regulator, ferric uptake regulator